MVGCYRSEERAPCKQEERDGLEEEWMHGHPRFSVYDESFIGNL